MDINLGKLETLIRGERLPDSRAEELFILTYKCGLGDELLLLTLLQIRDILDSLSSDEKNFLILGFCLGQKTFRDVEDNSIESFINNKPNTTQ